jgi:V/A-type H+-transporting ATPase subunit C
MDAASDRIIERLAITANVDELASVLKVSKFGKYFVNADFDYIEQTEYLARTKKMRRWLSVSEDAPVAFTAYMFLSEIELRNLITIIESTFYNANAEETMKLIITTDN